MEKRRKSSIDAIKRPKTPNFKSKQKPSKNPIKEETTKKIEEKTSVISEKVKELTQ